MRGKRRDWEDKKREEAQERAQRYTRTDPKGLREQVKHGGLTPSDALATIPGASNSSRIVKWLRNRMNRKPTPPPGGFHGDKRRRKRKQKDRKEYESEYGT